MRGRSEAGGFLTHALIWQVRGSPACVHQQAGSGRGRSAGVIGGRWMMGGGGRLVGGGGRVVGGGGNNPDLKGGGGGVAGEAASIPLFWQVVVEALRAKLHLNATMLQIPIGLSKDHVGVVDLVSQQAL